MSRLKRVLKKILSFRLLDLAHWVRRVYRQGARSKLSESQSVLLRLMRSDNLQAGSPFAPLAQWSKLTREFNQVMRVEGIGEVEAQYYNQRFSQSPPTSKRYYRDALWMLYRLVKQKDRHHILGRVSATVGQNTGLAYVFEGNLVSWDLLISIDTLYAIGGVKEELFTEPVVVADLGAGWGRIGYVLKKINPRSTYVTLDLPESLLICMTRLPQLLPNEKVFGYKDIRGMPAISKLSLSQGGIWFCGPQDLLRFDDGSIDVFVNIASFQEMTKDQIGAYLGLVDRKVRGVFYTQQYWDNPGEHARYGAIAGIGDYEFPPHWRKYYLRNVAFSERYFEAAFQVGE